MHADQRVSTPDCERVALLDRIEPSARSPRHRSHARRGSARRRQARHERIRVAASPAARPAVALVRGCAEILEAIGTTCDPVAFAGRLAQRLRPLLGLRSLSLWLYDARTNQLACASSRGAGTEGSEPADAARVGGPASWRLAAPPPGLYWLPRGGPARGQHLNPDFVSALARHRVTAYVPLLHQGELLGLLCLGAVALHVRRARLVEEVAQAVALGLWIANQRYRLLCMSRVLTQAADDLRFSIGRRIHDAPQQRLTALVGCLKEWCDALEQDGAGDQGELTMARHLLDLADAALCEMGALRVDVSGFDPRRHRSIKAALEEYLVDDLPQIFPGAPPVIARLDVLAALDQPLRARYPAASSLIVLLVREGVSNACKHARATRIALTARYDGSTFVLTIADNGCGMDVGALDLHRGTPLVHCSLIELQARAEQIGGELRMMSTPRRGTRLELRLPLLRVEVEGSGTQLRIPQARPRARRLLSHPAAPLAQRLADRAPRAAG